MARAENTDVVDSFETFYREYCRDDIGDLAQKYPTERKSLFVDYQELYRFDRDLAADVRDRPAQLREYAEEALRLYDLPIDVSLGQAHVRFENLSETTEIREIRADHRGRLLAVQGIVRKATDVRPKITTAAFECQRCGTLTRIPQGDGSFQEPHECQGCERQGPFEINFDQSEFVDAQKLRVQESPEGLRGGETPQAIDVHIEDDVTGEVTAGDNVRVTGVLHLEQQGNDREKSPLFDVYMEGMTVAIEDEQFEEMDITPADKERIVELANDPDIYDRVVDSIAPSIYGYDEQKLAIALQLFSGVTKNLPDGSRIRGDLHLLLIGDPGTGKSQLLQYIRNIAPRSVYTSGKGASSAGLCVTGDTRIHTNDGFRRIDSIVESDLPDPVDRETSVPRSIDVQTFGREDGTMQTAASSHVWRMPEKPCRRIETNGGRELEASVNTPVLTCGENGLTWTPISEIESGDYVAMPDYDDLDREAVPVRDYLDLRTEKLLLTDDTVEWFRERLTDEFGTLRDAAAALDLSEDFIYLHLKNRHVPMEKLDRMLDAIGATRADVEFDQLMCRHGDSVTIPETFDGDLMYLLGLVFGDGDIALDRRDGNRGMVRLSNGDEQILQRAQDIFETKFDYRPEIERQDDRVPSIRVHSATIARLFANAGMSTPKTGLELDSRLTTASDADAFLRGLMDADGSVSGRDDGGSSVLLSTISEALGEQVQFMLDTYGVQAGVRERDRRGTAELADGRTIESRHVQYYLEIYGADIDRYATAVGFEIPEKQAALDSIVGERRRRDKRVPVGAALATTGSSSSEFYHNLNRGDHPGRERARSILDEVDLGEAEPVVREAVEADLRWDEVVAAVDTGEKELYDLTVPETHNFVGNGIVTHNTAAAVRDDFGDGQQWTLEAGALVLADQGIAAIDELDKMKCVTGDTLVQFGDRVARVRDVAHEAARDGTIEPLDNGRTIRECDLDVWTMTESGRIERRPVTAIHEYDAPETLIRVTLQSGATLTTTPDHPFMLRDDSERIEREAAALQCGDRVLVPDSSPVATDGGLVESPPATGDPITDPSGVSSSPVAATETIDREAVAADHVYDLTVAGTHNYVANGMVVHNSEDRSAMHEALEQQSISISKAGINATLKSRCSLLGAANPKYGRFDQYEPIGEQIDLEPALVSRFDLIFTITDQPDPDEDAELADHILTTNYAGELETHRTKAATPNHGAEAVEAVTEDVEPAIDPELLRKYVAYAKRSCFPTMTDEARAHLRDFYVDLRTSGADEDAPVPVTARKLEALVRLAEASARVRLGDQVTDADAHRATDIASYCLEDIGMDPETGELDADVIETGRSKSQRDRIKNIKGIIADIEDEYDEGAPVDVVIDRAEEAGMEPSKADHEIEKLKQKGEVYEPRTDHLRTT
ncbi:LAGLIDADG family homing endonuclease [Halococcoides cellulosivorans]|uniref:DNA helicase n=1 Tax=Halococcoides cellulosivorans TaxID=1679096 RepID=A0A2R4X2J3_9EURY|nr:LAGLIDADG family homing endonuclease [Halococcoides cellulosivorans]AWB28016.1 XRE family transcriptional regulator [Halococcoides cellulosivorans]